MALSYFSYSVIVNVVVVLRVVMLPKNNIFQSFSGLYLSLLSGSCFVLYHLWLGFCIVLLMIFSNLYASLFLHLHSYYISYNKCVSRLCDLTEFKLLISFLKTWNIDYAIILCPLYFSLKYKFQPHIFIYMSKTDMTTTMLSFNF